MIISLYHSDYFTFLVTYIVLSGQMQSRILFLTRIHGTACKHKEHTKPIKYVTIAYIHAIIAKFIPVSNNHPFNSKILNI